MRATEKGGGLLMNIGTGGRDQRARALRGDGRLTGYPEPPNHAPERPGELLRSALDPGRAAIHLGWKPWTALDDGLLRTIDWFRDRDA